MKIVLLSEVDYAGSAYKLFEALRRHTDHSVELFSGEQNRLKHPVNKLVNNSNREEVQQIINEADVLHFKGDWPPRDGYLGLKIPDKPIVITTSGSFARKKEHFGLEKYSVKDYGRVTLRTSFEIDLLYPEYSDIWTPHPIDSDDKPILPKNRNDIIFMHNPSTPSTKGTEFVKKVFKILVNKIDCRAVIYVGLSLKDSLETKKLSTIYFDQFRVGFYGNAALEAMQWGIPTVCWFSPWTLSQANGHLKGCPLIQADLNDPERTAYRVIESLFDDTLPEKTKAWCDKRHGYKAIAEQWNNLYNQL